MSFCVIFYEINYFMVIEMQSFLIDVKNDVVDTFSYAAKKSLSIGDAVIPGVGVGLHYVVWIGRVVTRDIGWATASAVAASSYFVFSFSYHATCKLLEFSQFSDQVKLVVPYVAGAAMTGVYSWMLAVPTITALSLTALGMTMVTLMNFLELLKQYDELIKQLQEQCGNQIDKILEKTLKPKKNSCSYFNVVENASKNETAVPQQIKTSFIFAFRGAIAGIALETVLKISNLVLGTGVFGWGAAFTFGAINAAVLYSSKKACDWISDNITDHWLVGLPVMLLINGAYYYFSPVSLITNVAMAVLSVASSAGIKKFCESES